MLALGEKRKKSSIQCEGYVRTSAEQQEQKRSFAEGKTENVVEFAVPRKNSTLGRESSSYPRFVSLQIVS